MNIQKHKKKKPDWRHGKVAKLLLYFILETYEYIQGGFFFGPSNLILKMCNDVCDMLKPSARMLIY